MEYSFEIPSGLLEDGESPRDGASREIQEETGYRTKTLKYLMKYHDVGFANGWGYLFFGRVNKEGKQKLDANEFMEVKEIEISRFEEMIKNNKIIHSPTLLTWFIAKEQGLIPEL